MTDPHDIAPRTSKVPESLTDLPGYGIEPKPDEAYVAEGQQAAHEWGVQYQGSFEGEADGTARAVRLHARALHAAGIPVFLQSFTGRFRGADGNIHSAEATAARVKAEVADLVHASIRSLRVRIKHAVIPHSDFLRSWVIPRSVMLERDPRAAQALMQALYKTTIIYSVWERTTIDPNIAGILRRVAECWVPSEHNAALLREHGIERVTVVPHPWEPDSPLARAIERKPLAEKRFYAIGIWQPRKGFHELLGAFLTAFQPGDRVHLTIKYQEYRWPGYPGPEESIAHWLADPSVRTNGWREDNLKPHLGLYGKHWPEDKIHALHFASNIYVSSSHGEAYGLPAFDAKLCGNRLIHIPWGGSADFSDAFDVALPYALEAVPASYRWEPGARWASLDFGALVTALRFVAVPPVYERNPRVEACRFDHVGRSMRERVEAVLKSSS
ncbi:MAG TPA: glycosyltransferase [Candidatus Krumholzibacteria bacterium]